MENSHRLLIGGIGDDAHSVGIRLLALAFKEHGFFVKNLGIRNDISQFINQARDFDLIMMSSSNGHAEMYLQDFGRLLNQYRLTDDSQKLWYLGGNLTVNESIHAIKKKYIEMGFTDVFPKPISLEQILAEVRRSLGRHNIPQREIDRTETSESRGQRQLNLDEVSDEKWSLEKIELERKAVLAEWKTGADVDLSSADKMRLASTQNLDFVLWQAKTNRTGPLLHPRSGVAEIDEQIEILQFLEASGANISSVQLDAASRSKWYAQAELGIALSRERKRSCLNGFPVPVYGVAGVRNIVDSINTPFQLRAGGPDHRFTYEIALNGGATGVEGGFICYLLPYDKTTSPTDSLRFWQYADRLCALYDEQHGIVVNREYFGPLTANLIEPSLAIVVNIVQAILSAKQGVKSISLGYAEQGNRVQDIAALQVLEELAHAYLHKYGLFGCRVTTVFHQYMAAFPRDAAKAEDLIFNSAITATLAGATKIMIKSPVEAFKIPSRAENALGVSITRKGVQAAQGHFCNWPLVELEKSIIELEVTQIMDAIEELGHGSLARGAIRALQEGYLDIPFSPHICNKNEVLTLRDRGGAVRFAEFGNLPFTSYLKDWHRERIEERKSLERDPRLFSLLEKDLTRIWANDYRAWPLDNLYVD
jgi:methylaspartate mutase epsilon subunit